MAGATPVLVDIDESRMTMCRTASQATLEALRGWHRFRAIIPVHLYGQPADIHRIVDIGRREGLYVIEDCAQAHGATVGGRKVGTFGEFGAFSFYPTKNLGALGDGGALVAMDSDLIDRARALREYGWRQRYISHEAGVNSRLDPVQAAALRVKLPFLDAGNERRRRIAGRYNDALEVSPLPAPRAVPR